MGGDGVGTWRDGMEHVGCGGMWQGVWDGVGGARELRWGEVRSAITRGAT